MSDVLKFFELPVASDKFDPKMFYYIYKKYKIKIDKDMIVFTYIMRSGFNNSFKIKKPKAIINITKSDLGEINSLSFDPFKNIDGSYTLYFLFEGVYIYKGQVYGRQCACKESRWLCTKEELMKLKPQFKQFKPHLFELNMLTNGKLKIVRIISHM